MIFKRIPKLFIGCVLALSLLVTACGITTSAPPTTTQPPSAEEVAAANPVAGGKLNQFFPQSGGGYNVVFAQEKTGFAEAKLKQGGADVAMLSINDIANNAAAASKFQGSSQNIGGYPAVTQGKNTTAVLVGNRYQVKVQSRSEGFTASDRQTWIQKFNLNGLAKLR